jgi:hypothetical protein
VARKLTEKAALFVEYTRKMGLSMNAAKTQILFLSRAGNVSNTTVEVDGCTIYPGNVIELLGVKYDRRLSTGLHIKALLAAVRQRASVVARLANHLPCGSCHTAWSWASSPTHWRLEHEDNASVTWSKIQVAINDVARSITGARGATTSPSRTCSTWPGSRARTGWW